MENGTINHNKNVDDIIRKVKGLLAKAKDGENDSESQSAFLMAQKLMIKYKIAMSDVEDEVRGTRNIEEGMATAFKKLFWWERELANIIERNFPVKWFYRSKTFGNEKQRKRTIIFMGFEDDVLLAKEMYVLAYDVTEFYTKQYVEQMKEKSFDNIRLSTARLKNSYLTGFLNGLNKKFEQQKEQMIKENHQYGLMVITPVEVQENYDKRFEKAKSISFNTPPVEVAQAYNQGFDEGVSVDYTKSTLDE